MPKKIILSKNLKETQEIAKKIALNCKGGEIFTLEGDLGTGKTAFSQGLADGLGVKSQVNSPTFNILKLYKANLNKIKTFCHIDAYRLNNGNDLINIGFTDYLNDKTTVIAIEWPKNAISAIPKKSIKISLKSISLNTREITIES